MAFEDDVLAYLDGAQKNAPTKQQKPQAVEPFDVYYKRRAGGEQLLPQEHNKIVDDYTNTFADLAVTQAVGQRPKRGVAQYDEAAAAARDEWSSTVAQLVPKKKIDGGTDTAKNYAKSAGSALLGWAKNVGELTGGGSITDYLDEASKNLSESKTETSRIEAGRQTQQRQYAENSGSFLGEIATYVKTIRGEDVVGGAASVLPEIALGLATGGAGSVATRAAMISAKAAGTASAAARAAIIGERAAIAQKGVMMTSGVAQGVGGMKGDIAERVERDALAKGFSKDEAKRLADEANDYPNIPVDQTLLAGVIGAAGGITGAERAFIGGKAVTNAASQGAVRRIGQGILEEGTQEGVQGAQSRREQNRASIALGLTNDTLNTGLVGSFASDFVLGGLLGAGTNVRSKPSISITDIQNADPLMQKLAPARKSQIGKLVLNSDINELAADEAALGDKALARRVAIKILEQRNGTQPSNDAGNTALANDTFAEPSTAGVESTLDDATRAILAEAQQYDEQSAEQPANQETVGNAATATIDKPVSTANQSSAAASIVSQNGGADAQPNLTEQVSEIGIGDIATNQRSEPITNAADGNNATTTASGAVQNYGQIAAFNPSETGNKPRTEAINRLNAEIEAEGYPVSNESAQIVAENHWDSYKDYLKATGATDSANREKFISGTVDNMLATAALDGKPLSDVDQARAEKRLNYLNQNEPAWTGLERGLAGDRQGRSEAQYRKDMGKVEAQVQAAPTAPVDTRTPAEIAENTRKTNIATARKKQAKRNALKPFEGNPFLYLLMDKGIRSDQARGEIKDFNPFSVATGKMYRGSGETLDSLVEIATEQGFLPTANNGQADILRLIDDVSRKTVVEPVYSQDFQDKIEREAMTDAQLDAAIAATDNLTPAQRALEPNPRDPLELYDLLGYDVDSWDVLLQPTAKERNDSLLEFLGVTQKEYDAQYGIYDNQRAQTESSASATKANTAGNGSNTAQSEPIARAPAPTVSTTKPASAELTLEQPTPADLRAKSDREAAAPAAERAALDKLQGNTEGGFQLNPQEGRNDATAPLFSQSDSIAKPTNPSNATAVRSAIERIFGNAKGVWDSISKSTFPITEADIPALVKEKPWLEALASKSVADVKKLSYRAGNKDVSLDKFAEQFQGLIKQKDTKNSDVERIAKDVVQKIIDSPSAFLPQATGESLGYKQYLTMNDGLEYDPMNIAHADASDLTVAIYNAKKNGTLPSLLEREAKNLNDKRVQDLNAVATYLNNNQDYNIAEQAMILDGARKYSIQAKQGENGVTVSIVSISSKNRASVPVIDGVTASLIAKELRNGKSIKDAMRDGAQAAHDKASESKDASKNGWVTYKKSDTEADAALLNKGVAGREWCTAGSVETARSQLAGGDFHVYYEKGEPLVAIRTQDGRMAEPPRGSLSGQALTEKESAIADDFLRNEKKVTGGEAYLEDRDFIAKVQSGDFSSEFAFFNQTKKRKSKDGYGSNSRDFPESIQNSLADKIESVGTKQFYENGYAVYSWFTNYLDTPENNKRMAEERAKVKVLIGSSDELTLLHDDNWFPNLEKFVGDVKLDHPEDGRFFSKLKEVNGLLVITPFTIASNLKKVTGDVYANDGSRLDSLREVGGKFITGNISNYPLLERQTPLASKGGLGNAQALYDPRTGHIYLVTDRIQKGTEDAVWLHEVGHRQLLPLLGKENLAKLHGAVTSWRGRKEGTVERAIYEAANSRADKAVNELTQADKETDAQFKSRKQELYNAEFLAYAIEEAVNRGVTPDAKKGTISAAGWMAKVKQLFEDALAKLIGRPSTLEANDLVAMAYGAAGLELQQSNLTRDQHNAPYADSDSLKSRRKDGGNFSLEEIVNGYHNQPSDYFDKKVGARYYSYDTAEGRESFTAINNLMQQSSIKKQLSDITIYRAVPAGSLSRSASAGDWITLSKSYAILHGESRFGKNNYRIIEQSALPKNVWWDGNDINEFGYDDSLTSGNVQASLTPFDGKEQAKTPLGDTKTVTVDGVDYSVFNNLGKPIHPTVEGVRNFWRWFSTDGVADKNGAPLVLYRSGREEINSATEQTTWFSTSKPIAATYGSALQEFYVKLGNSEYIDARGRTWDDIDYEGGAYSTDSIADNVKAIGYDGLHIENVIDGAADSKKTDAGVVSDIYVTFGGNSQFKSATGNNGDFSPANNDITRSIAPSGITSYAAKSDAKHLAAYLANDEVAGQALVDKASSEANYPNGENRIEKSLDPFTFDDAGNLIPLSQRFDNTNQDVRYSLGSSMPSLAATKEIARTGKLRSQSYAVLDADKWAEKLVDSTRPFDVWTRGIEDQGAAATMISGKNRAAGMEADMHKNVLRDFGLPFSTRIKAMTAAINKGKSFKGRYKFDAVQQLVGYWMSATYAPIANQNILKKDTAALQEAVVLANELSTEKVELEADRSIINKYVASGNTTLKTVDYIAMLQRRENRLNKQINELTKDINGSSLYVDEKEEAALFYLEQQLEEAVTAQKEARKSVSSTTNNSDARKELLLIDREISRLGKRTGNAKAAVTRAKNIVLKRQAAIIDPRIIDPTNQNLDIGLAGGYNNATAAEMRATVEVLFSKEQLEAAAKPIYAMNAWKLKTDIALGKVPAEVAATFDQSGKYVPLTGDPRADEKSADVFGTGSVNQGKDRAIQGRSTSLAQDGVTASFEQVQKTARYHGWSDFKDALHAMYESAVAKEVGNGQSVIDANRIARETTGMSRSVEGMERPSDNVIIYRKNGESWVYDLHNEDAVRGLRKANDEPIPSYLQPVAFATRTMSRMVTQFMVGFAPVNAIRDVWEKSENLRTRILPNNPNLDMNKVARSMLTSSMNLPRLYRAITPVVAQGTPLQAMAKLDANNPDQALLIQFLKDGGGATWGDYLARDGKDLAKKLAKQHSLGTKAIEVLDVWNNSWELISSFTAYKAMIENGVSGKDAANAALELMNFRKGGTYMKPIKALYMFAQPIATGGQQLIKTLATRRGQVRFAAYMTAGMALYAMLRSGEDDEELGVNRLDEVSNFALERSIPIPVGNGTYIKIPIGFGSPMLAWGYAVNLVKMALGTQTVGETAAELLLKMPFKTFAPVSPSEASISKQFSIWLTQTVTPSFLKPVANVALDVNFAGGALTNARFAKPEQANALEGRTNTAQFYKDIAKELALNGIDLYPEQVREIIKGYAIGPLNELIKAQIENPAKEARGKNPPSVFLDRWVLNQDRDELKQKLFYRKRAELNEVGVKASLGKELNDEEKQQLKLLEEVKRLEGSARGIKSAGTKQFKITKNQATLDTTTKRYEEAQSKLMVRTITRMNTIEATH